ncbi:MAG TPA: GNAT family N-acetyltransferase [Abditibacterium sp.]|jgi:GNAT superfamily N-acetyltransferase
MSYTLQKPETRYHLEMRRPEELRPAPPVPEELELKRLEYPDPELRRYLYQQVGEEWAWRDRAYWTDDEWTAHFYRSDVEIWVLWFHHEPAGYFELESTECGCVRITHFGLRESFMGRGIGGYLLTLALRRAWSIGAARVWLHTSSLDHPHALANYQARGLRLFKTEVVAPAATEH